MKIKDILLNLGIPSNEIKTRFKANRIKLNGKDVQNLDLDINENFIYDCGEFFTDYCSLEDMKVIKFYINSLDYEIGELFGNESKIKVIDNLSEFLCLTVSKNEHYILMKN